MLAELVENKPLGLTNHYFATPTPGGFNSSDYLAYVADLKFSPDRGLYQNTNFYVSITTATPGTTIRERILTLPEETLVLPGHGPSTTVGQERDANPFLT